METLLEMLLMYALLALAGLLGVVIIAKIVFKDRFKLW